MTADHSTYTYETGEQETVTLRHGTADPRGHALLRITYNDGETLDCYVNTAWLRDRLDDLDPRPLTPGAITDEMVERAGDTYVNALRNRGYTASLKDSYIREVFREALTAALTEPTRPEGAEKVEAVLHQYWSGDIDGDDLADRIAEEMNR